MQIDIHYICSISQAIVLICNSYLGGISSQFHHNDECGQKFTPGERSGEKARWTEARTVHTGKFIRGSALVTMLLTHWKVQYMQELEKAHNTWGQWLHYWWKGWAILKLVGPLQYTVGPFIKISKSKYLITLKFLVALS